MTTGRYLLSFSGDENVPKLDAGTAAQPCKYTETHGILHHKWVDFIVGELHLNTAAGKMKMIEKTKDGAR